MNTKELERGFGRRAGPGRFEGGVACSIIPCGKFDSDTLSFWDVVLSAWMIQLPIRTYTTGNSPSLLRDSHHLPSPWHRPQCMYVKAWAA